VKSKAVHSTSAEQYLRTIAVAPYVHVPVMNPNANTTYGQYSTLMNPNDPVSGLALISKLSMNKHPNT
jgi:hypothetical protein